MEWDGASGGSGTIEGALQAPVRGSEDLAPPRPLERSLRWIGVPEHLARLLSATPSLRLSWMASVASILTLATAAARAHPDGSGTTFLVLAPLLPLAGVALAYGPASDPSFDIARAAPLSSFRLMLLRATAVLLGTTGIALVAGAFLPGSGWQAAAWILPSLAVTLSGLLLGTFIDGVAAAGTVAFAWVAGVLTYSKLADDVAQVFGGPAQVGFSVIAIGLAGGVVRRRDRFEIEQRVRKRELVSAADAERRRLERNLHDGAQQQLVGIGIKVRLIRNALERDRGAALALLDQLDADVADAMASLRDLARGMYPPVLAEHGLVSALGSQIERHGLPVSLDARTLGRYAPEIEATVYFCCLEALQNISKYARASSARISLSGSAGELSFRVRDDGIGFEVARTQRGAGLRNMEERVAAFGGTLLVD